MNRLSFVEFWKIIQVFLFFAQKKEFVIKLLKFLNWVNNSVKLLHFRSSKEATEEIKKKCVEEFFLRFYIM